MQLCGQWCPLLGLDRVALGSPLSSHGVGASFQTLSLSSTVCAGRSCACPCEGRQHRLSSALLWTLLGVFSEWIFFGSCSGLWSHTSPVFMSATPWAVTAEVPPLMSSPGRESELPSDLVHIKATMANMVSWQDPYPLAGSNLTLLFDYCRWLSFLA